MYLFNFVKRKKKNYCKKIDLLQHGFHAWVNIFRSKPPLQASRVYVKSPCLCHHAKDPSWALSIQKKKLLGHLGLQHQVGLIKGIRLHKLTIYWQLFDLIWSINQEARSAIARGRKEGRIPKKKVKTLAKKETFVKQEVVFLSLTCMCEILKLLGRQKFQICSRAENQEVGGQNSRPLLG